MDEEFIARIMFVLNWNKFVDLINLVYNCENISAMWSKYISFNFLTFQLIAGPNTFAHAINNLEFLTSCRIGWLKLCPISLFPLLWLTRVLNNAAVKSNLLKSQSDMVFMLFLVPFEVLQPR